MELQKISGYKSWQIAEKEKEMSRKYDAWAEGYARAISSGAYSYNPENSIKEERIGNWIVCLQKYGPYNLIAKIYNAETKMEHYKSPSISTCFDTAPEDVKAFYERWAERTFQQTCDIARKWN